MKLEFNNGSVELLDTMPSNEETLWKTIVNSARVSYNNDKREVDEEKDLKLLRYLVEHEHGSPLEMVDFKFKIKLDNASVIHLLRHRISSLNSQSYRYTQADKDGFYIIEKWRVQSKTNKQNSSFINGFSEEMNIELTKSFIKHLEYCMVEYDRLIALGVAREQARYVLPAYALQTTFIWKINLRSLLNFLKLRMANNAQHEIRNLAFAISNIIKEVDIVLYNELIYKQIILPNPSKYSF